MEAYILDGCFVPFLIPSIMGVNLYKQLKDDSLDLLYATTTLGIILSTSCSLLHFHLSQHTRSRTRLTLLMSLMLTLTTIASILGFNCIRIGFEDTYNLPTIIRSHTFNDSVSLIRYHFYADIIPGCIIFLSSIISLLTSNELLCRAKRNFTLGEATLFSQLILAAFLTWSFTTYTRLTGAGPYSVTLQTDIVLNVGFVAVSLVFLPAYLFLKGKATISRYALLGLSLSVTYIVIQNLISSSSKLDPLTWLVDHIFLTHQRISLFSLWISTLAACGSFSLSWTRMVGRTNSLVRKVFHLAVCVVFISGYNQDIEFTRFAAGGILIVLILLELIRAWQLQPVGPHLEKVCHALRGKWDNKYITLSHIYLLIGTFLPLWLIPAGKSDETKKLVLSSGIIAVGVGDTAAAIIGTFLGRNKLGKSEKTIEGLVGNMLAMIIFKMIWVGYTNLVLEYAFLIAVIMTALTEAITDNCDNLILPLVMILLIELL